jgi:hypothetical protein
MYVKKKALEIIFTTLVKEIDILKEKIKVLEGYKATQDTRSGRWLEYLDQPLDVGLDVKFCPFNCNCKTAKECTFKLG